MLILFDPISSSCWFNISNNGFNNHSIQKIYVYKAITLISDVIPPVPEPMEPVDGGEIPPAPGISTILNF